MIRTLLTILMPLALSGCAVYTTPEPSTSVQVSPIPSQPEITVAEVSEISSFAPTRGEQSVYNLNESISFQVSTIQGGYLTLTAYGPDNVATILAQGVFVEGGVETVLPAAGSGVTYTLTPPRGLQRVTATLSSDPTGAVALDTAETTFFIQ